MTRLKLLVFEILVNEELTTINSCNVMNFIKYTNYSIVNNLYIQLNQDIGIFLWLKIAHPLEISCIFIASLLITHAPHKITGKMNLTEDTSNQSLLIYAV